MLIRILCFEKSLFLSCLSYHPNSHAQNLVIIMQQLYKYVTKHLCKILGSINAILNDLWPFKVLKICEFLLIQTIAQISANIASFHKFLSTMCFGIYSKPFLCDTFLNRQPLKI